MKTSLYVIGDSHVSVFLGKDRLAECWPDSTPSLISGVEVIRLGPVTAYNLCNYNSSTRGRENLEQALEKKADKNAWIMISAGEIDCRVHLVKKAIAQNLPFTQVASEVASRFIHYLNGLKDQGYKICLLLPPPAAFIEEDDPLYPRTGSEFERNLMTRELIIHLESLSADADIPVIDIFSESTNEALETVRSYLWDGIHLSTRALPSLVSQLRAETGISIHLPLSWHAREQLRKVKKLSTNIFHI
jgi:lysophospholipase L1-like esterase